jgi:beta-xylosidase
MEYEKNTRNTWAPEITYDTKKDIYIIYWASTITNRYPQTDTSAESKYNHRIYYVTTKDLKNSARLNCCMILRLVS